MAIKGFYDFFKKLGGFPTGTGGAEEQPQIKKEQLEALLKTYDSLNKKMESLQKTSAVYEESLIKLKTELGSLSNNNRNDLLERKKIEAKIKLIEESKEKLEIAIDENDAQLKEFLTQSAKIHKTTAGNLFNFLEGFGNIGTVLNHTTNHVNPLVKTFHSAIGEIGDANKITGIFAKTLSGVLNFAVAGAINQVVELSDKLILFNRATGNVLSPSVLGFDSTGNNQQFSRVGSLNSLANTNNLSVDELLNPIKAFYEGNIIGSVNLKEESKNLQDYGIEIGRLNKLYGISDENTRLLGKTLTQQYNISISDSIEIMKRGALVAKNAGVNVGIFFENLSKISQLQGSLFVRGGAEGIEQAAFSLTKLNLNTDSLTKITDSYNSFSELIDKQQKYVALGLNNLGSIQGKIFAKVQTGDASGAVNLQQYSAAKDMSRGIYSNKDGIINSQGIMALKSSGFSDEEIKSVQRLINMQKRVGASFDDLANETNLTSVQLKMKNKIEAENITLQEHVNVAWGRIKAVLFDPLAALIGPTLVFSLEVISSTFKILHTTLKPLIWTFERLGQAISYVTKWNSDDSNEGRVVGLLSKILSVVILIAGARYLGPKLGKLANTLSGGATRGLGQRLLGQRGASLFGVGAGSTLTGVSPMATTTSLSGLHFPSMPLNRPSVLGGFKGLLNPKGLVSGLGKSVMKGGLKGGLVGIGTDLVGGMIGDAIKGDSEKGSTQSTIGSSVSGAATGASIGMLLAPLTGGISIAVGAGIGAIAGAIGDNLGEYTDSWDKFFSKDNPLWGWDLLISPVSAIFRILNDDKREKESAKFGSIAATSGKQNTFAEIEKIFNSRKFDNSVHEQSEKENMVNSNQIAKPSVVNVNVHTPLAAFKTKISGT